MEYQVWYNNNVESFKIAEFDTLEKAKNYCKEEVKGYKTVGRYDNDYEGKGNNFRFEIYEGEPIITDEDGNIIETKDSVYETQRYYKD